MSPEILQLIVSSTLDTLVMVGLSGLLGTLFGFLATSHANEPFASPNRVLGLVVNATFVALHHPRRRHRAAGARVRRHPVADRSQGIAAGGLAGVDAGPDVDPGQLDRLSAMVGAVGGGGLGEAIARRLDKRGRKS